jgi:ADP-ribose pyrophosphatase
MKITKVEPLARGRWLNLFRIDYRRADGGKDRSWSVATRQALPKCAGGRFADPDVVIIVPYHTGRGRLVLIREFRPILAGDGYGFPAGLVDEGETVEAAAARELREETGLEVVRVTRTSPPIYSSPGMTDESSALVYVECDGTPENASPHDGERIEVVFVTPEEAGRLCADPALKFDAKAWIVTAQFAATGTV